MASNQHQDYRGRRAATLAHRHAESRSLMTKFIKPRIDLPFAVKGVCAKQIVILIIGFSRINPDDIIVIPQGNAERRTRHAGGYVYAYGRYLWLNISIEDIGIGQPLN